MSKKEFYADLTRDLAALSRGEYNFIATLSNASALIYERLENVNWAGFYLIDGNTLVLAPFQGNWPVYVFQWVRAFAERRMRKMRFSAWPMCMLLQDILPVMPPAMLKLCCLSR